MISANMKFALVGVLGALASLESVAAHGHVAALVIDGNYYGGSDPSNHGGDGITPIIPGDNSDQGFKDLTSEEVATNAPDLTKASIHAAVSGGSVIQWFWNTWPSSHLGPVSAFMSRCPDTGCSGYNGNTATNWFKVSEAGFNTAINDWASYQIQEENNFGWQMTMPTDLESGYYLIRHDILAMHTTDAPQDYPIVFWAYLTSSGTTVPTTVGAFPAMYDNSDALTWNIYSGTDQTAFVIPGVDLYEASLAGNAGPVKNGTALPTSARITTDAGPGGATSTPSNTTSAASSAVVSSAVSSAASSAISTSASVVASASVSTSAVASVAVSVSSSAIPVVTATATDTTDYCDEETVTSTITVSAAQATSASTTASSAADDGTCSDDVVTVTVTAASGAQTTASGAGFALSSSVAAGSSFASASGAAPTGNATRVKGNGRHRGSATASIAASSIAPAAALATTSAACECPTTRNFVERDAMPLIEEVHTRSGPKFLARGLVFTSEIDARAACGTDCEFLSASKRKVESRWTRAFF